MTVQPSLFDEPVVTGVQWNYLDVPGLGYCPGLLSEQEQKRVLHEIDARPWLGDLKRRVQHYGYKYDYKARSIDRTMYVGPLPLFAVEVAGRLLEQGLLDETPDQLIVNEYQPGQGISAHVDCEPCFKNTIATVSLGSVYEMDFIRVTDGTVKSMLLGLGSALVFRDEARYRWMHRIQARKTDHGVPRGRRVSLTFRNVVLAE